MEEKREKVELEIAEKVKRWSRQFEEQNEKVQELCKGERSLKEEGAVYGDNYNICSLSNTYNITITF